ncbi:DUF1028 domain-containing protein [Corynebacterium glutamicum]|uniref:DUF1028 domain-containing protein n=1 Tax=Corynebacterium glutamicum TaxID=1718 RepID=UPI001B8AA94E|nr:DUF1028 domain-containing protein [Corynebacterium glutamicum]
MTFSIVARDNSGAIGMAVCSSSPAVAARCLHLQAGVGVVASQNITDPRFGPLLLLNLANGASAEEALRDLVSADETLDYRQISILPIAGQGLAHSGSHTLGVFNSVVSSNAVAAGNMLKDPAVIEKMIQAFESSEGELETRLMGAMLAGLNAGGEAGPVHSAGIAVARSSGWAETDLRIDWSDQPIEDLSKLLQEWLIQRDDYVIRGIDPSKSPAYGVPGDE